MQRCEQKKNKFQLEKKQCDIDLQHLIGGVKRLSCIHRTTIRWQRTHIAGRRGRWATVERNGSGFFHWNTQPLNEKRSLTAPRLSAKRRLLFHWLTLHVKIFPYCSACKHYWMDAHHQHSSNGFYYFFPPDDDESAFSVWRVPRCCGISGFCFLAFLTFLFSLFIVRGYVLA